MRYKTESHLHALTILEGEFADEWKDLRLAFEALRPTLRDAAPFTDNARPLTPKRHKRSLEGKSRYALLPIDQNGMNTQLAGELRGWRRQPFVLGRTIGGEIDTHLKGDFERNGVFVEVEFGNAASLFRDLFKFHIAGQSGVGKAGVLVVAMGSISRLFDSGVTHFEQVVRLLPYMRIGLNLPVLIVGLDVEDWAPVKLRYEEMERVATANGVSCHSFDLVRRIDAADSDASTEET